MRPFFARNCEKVNHKGDDMGKPKILKLFKAAIVFSEHPQKYYARLCGVQPSAMSEILSGERILNDHVRDTLITELELEPAIKKLKILL